MSSQSQGLRLTGDIDQVRHACDFVVEFARQIGMGDDGLYQCELSIDEIFTNIVEHGYRYQGADKNIEITVEHRLDRLVISILDEAPLFNPLEIAEPDPSLDLWERSTGGWGVYFVRKYMDSVHYKVMNGHNCLVLEKQIK